MSKKEKAGIEKKDSIAKNEENEEIAISRKTVEWVGVCNSCDPFSGNPAKKNQAYF